ncbi:hypothetical protein [Nocardia altamirensis]|uniref:hypothetical protein n=1 Tax=Nocardia altamirensis TaxID=472158 RepID=UPI00084091A0|nr:hypothetical protein [Nocardia altamirensis]
MARFRLERHTHILGFGTLTTSLAFEDLAELIETARMWALAAAVPVHVRILDRSVELHAVEGAGVALVDAIDRWDINRTPPCAECGELQHVAQMTGRSIWYCHSCNRRTEAA